ncbi:helix-turn-helix domain-containing protein [Thiorhodovibrio winogradskyi]|uniref:helix-turn-helix domain-containing protein n=1 Tax=Thiorhodovibrio winogradskyi TaxID=77007 RepID=UPI0038B56498
MQQAATLDPKRALLTTADGQEHPLSDSECRLLLAFVRAEQNRLENWQIAEILDMDLDHFNKAALELHLVRLRKKIHTSSAAPSAIRAIRGRGYQLSLPIQLV